MSTTFFDIGATLADVSAGADGSLLFRPRPRVMEVLTALAGTRMGIISNPGEGDPARSRAVAALDAAFGSHFTDNSLIHWGSKSTRTIFDNAVHNAGVVADECVFVGEDPDERALARDAGMRTAAHPVFTRAAADGRPAFWIRIDLPAGRRLAELEMIANSTEVVPVHVPSDRLVLAMGTLHGVQELEHAGFVVDVRNGVGETAAFLVRDDRPVPRTEVFSGGSAEGRAEAETSARATAAFAFISGELTGLMPTVSSLGPAPGGVYIAPVAGTPIEELHIPGTRHGHTERLLPDPALLTRPGESHAEGFINGFTVPVPSPETIDAVRAAVTPSAIRGHIARISGVDPLIDGEPWKVRSRDAAADDNMLVVNALGRRLHDLGLVVRFHQFSWRGHRLANVEAEYRVEGSDGAVLVTAHLDSTAAEGEFVNSAGQPRSYDPTIDPAPGADDDGSGTAAVMVAAECLRNVVAAGREPARTLRFVLFNAEEQGLVGSKMYARAAAAAGDSIAAVIQMDMIAGLQGGARKVEIHAGSAVPGPVVTASNALGDSVSEAFAAVASDFEVQRLTGNADPAAGRSDHASFHERGWAAVAVSENFFDDTAPATGTRQYHMPGDTLGDADHDTDYAAEIARSITAAALTLAGL